MLSLVLTPAEGPNLWYPKWSMVNTSDMCVTDDDTVTDWEGFGNKKNNKDGIHQKDIILVYLWTKSYLLCRCLYDQMPYR